MTEPGPFDFLDRTMDRQNDWPLFFTSMLPSDDTDKGGWVTAIAQLRDQFDPCGERIPTPLLVFPPGVWRQNRAVPVPFLRGDLLDPMPTFGQAFLHSALAAGLSPRPYWARAFGSTQLVLRFLPIQHGQAEWAPFNIGLLRLAATPTTGQFDVGQPGQPATLDEALAALSTPFPFLTADADSILRARLVLARQSNGHRGARPARHRRARGVGLVARARQPDQPHCGAFPGVPCRDRSPPVSTDDRLNLTTTSTFGCKADPPIDD